MRDKLIKKARLPESLFEKKVLKEKEMKLIELFNFVKETLSFDYTVDVDGRKMLMNEDDWKELAKLEDDCHLEDNHYSWTWMNVGPAADYSVERGTIELYEGCMTRAENTDQEAS